MESLRKGITEQLLAVIRRVFCDRSKRYQVLLNNDEYEYLENLESTHIAPFMKYVEVINYSVRKDPNTGEKRTMLLFQFRATTEEAFLISAKIVKPLAQTFTVPKYYSNPINVFSISSEYIDTRYVVCIWFDDIAVDLAKWLYDSRKHVVRELSVCNLPIRYTEANLGHGFAGTSTEHYNLMRLMHRQRLPLDYYQTKVNGIVDSI